MQVTVDLFELIAFAIMMIIFVIFVITNMIVKYTNRKKELHESNRTHHSQ